MLSLNRVGPLRQGTVVQGLPRTLQTYENQHQLVTAGLSQQQVIESCFETISGVKPDALCENHVLEKWIYNEVFLLALNNNPNALNGKEFSKISLQVGPKNAFFIFSRCHQLALHLNHPQAVELFQSALEWVMRSHFYEVDIDNYPKKIADLQLNRDEVETSFLEGLNKKSGALLKHKIAYCAAGVFLSLAALYAAQNSFNTSQEEQPHSSRSILPNVSYLHAGLNALGIVGIGYGINSAVNSFLDPTNLLLRTTEPYPRVLENIRQEVEDVLGQSHPSVNAVVELSLQRNRTITREEMARKLMNLNLNQIQKNAILELADQTIQLPNWLWNHLIPPRKVQTSKNILDFMLILDRFRGDAYATYDMERVLQEGDQLMKLGEAIMRDVIEDFKAWSKELGLTKPSDKVRFFSNERKNFSNGKTLDWNIYFARAFFFLSKAYHTLINLDRLIPDHQHINFNGWRDEFFATPVSSEEESLNDTFASRSDELAVCNEWTQTYHKLYKNLLDEIGGGNRTLDRFDRRYLNWACNYLNLPQADRHTIPLAPDTELTLPAPL